MQNLFILMESSEHAEIVSSKVADMCLNRFCIDEDAAFEISGVNYLKKSSRLMIQYGDTTDMQSKRKSKGMGYSPRLQ